MLVIDAADRLLLVRSSRVPEEPEQGYVWSTHAELASSSETVYPFGLAALMADLVAGYVPAVPVALPWHH